jgi:hypothetical protein
VPSIRASVALGTSISERNEPAEANEPSHIATLFVALAETGAMPIARAAGNEMKLPPPAPALIPLAMKDAARTNRSPERLSSDRPGRRHGSCCGRRRKSRRVLRAG